MRSRILVTRPEPGATSSRKMLRAGGYHPIVLPLSEIVPLTVSCSVEPDRFRAIAITSANAIRWCQHDLLSSLRHLPVLAVGPSSAKAALEAGFMHVEVGDGNARSLARLVNRTLSPGERVLYLAGRIRRKQFEVDLAMAGTRVDVLEVYEAKLVSYTTEIVCDRMSDRAVDHVLVYSRMAARALNNLMARAELAHVFEMTNFVCLSASVSRALVLPAGATLKVARDPSSQAILEAIRGSRK